MECAGRSQLAAGASNNYNYNNWYFNYAPGLGFSPRPSLILGAPDVVDLQLLPSEAEKVPSEGRREGGSREANAAPTVQSVGVSNEDREPGDHNKPVDDF